MKTLTIALLATVAMAGSYVEIGHFQSGEFAPEWVPDFEFDRIMHQEWIIWPTDMTITNIRGSVVDGQYYDLYEFNIPEPATLCLLAIGGIIIRKGNHA